MTMTFLDTPADLQWLRDTHLKAVPNVPAFASAMVAGNEDAPTMITLYASSSPHVMELPVAVYTPDAAYEHYAATFPLTDDPRR